MTARFRRRDDIRLTELEGEGVVLHLGSREYFTVSETGLVLLKALEEVQTSEELVAALLDEYDVSPEHASKSVEEFLANCLREGLVIRAEGE